MKTSSLKSSLMLFLAAFIWGTAFVAQSVSMDYIDPFTMNCSRSLIGCLFLLPVIKLMRVMSRKNGEERKPDSKGNSKQLLIGGLICGILLCGATNFQQFGIKYTTVGKAGFITACYIVLVPVFGLFFKKKCTAVIWLGVVMALVGLYLLCIKEQLALSIGDLLCIVCAVIFSFHIIAVDHFSPLVDGVKLSCIQFLVNGIISGILMFIFEKPNIGNILSAWGPLLYTGVLSSGVAYTLQIISQKNLNPTVASLIMSLESVISVLAGWVLLSQVLSIKEIIGCVIMFSAIMLVQLFGTPKE